MHPILFHLGGFPVHTYGAMGALAFVVGAGLVLWRGHRLGFDPNRVADVIFWMALLSLAGARGVYVIQNPATIHGALDLVDLRGGGLVFYGSFVVGIPAGFLLMRRFELPAFAIWDLFGTAFPLAHAISRLGCYGAGCCYGAPTDAAWAVTYPPDSLIAPPGVPVHPAQLYEALALALIALATNVFWRFRTFDGQVFLLYLVLYAGARTVLELFRGDAERGWFLPELLGQAVTWSQGMSGVLAAVALAVFLVGARQAARKRAIGATIEGPRPGT